jgi:hypothetical protein
LAAVTAALALAVPMASASATTTAPDPAVAVVPQPLICVFLAQQIRFATLTGNPLLVHLLTRVYVFLGCKLPVPV